ncbi:MAG: class I SAM-dependent methyltransferase, partial [Malacoplasma sp.]|nr:class I SAM-dependent methyltransferase [Malacoplasma sp.]
MRIRSIANRINNAQVTVDIGSDHALLSIFLINEKRSAIVYNIEKNEGPFNNSVKNTTKIKNIINLMGDGLKNFDSSIHINYCVIAGMGAKTITQIIHESNNKVDYFITCSNNNYELIRKFAKENKFKIVFEETIKENGIYYEIICISKIAGKKIIFKNQIIFGVHSLKKNDLLYIEKLKSLL